MYPMYFQNHYMTIPNWTVKTYYLRGGHLNRSVIVFRVLSPEGSNDTDRALVEMEHWSADSTSTTDEPYPSFQVTVDGVSRNFTHGHAVVSDVARTVWNHFVGVYTEKDIERDLFPFVAIKP